jgi:predicted RNase H-like HicB family nuclease
MEVKERMIMEDVLNATDVRAEFSKFIDSVVREKPRAIKRNRDIVMSLSLEHFTDLLSKYELSMEFEQDEDGNFYGSIEQIEDIVGQGDTIEELRRYLAIQLVEYSQDYYNNFTRYYNAPNRRSHLPLVLLTLIQEDLEGVASLIRG